MAGVFFLSANETGLKTWASQILVFTMCPDTIINLFIRACKKKENINIFLASYIFFAQVCTI